jgi:hypothetical protein
MLTPRVQTFANILVCFSSRRKQALEKDSKHEKPRYGFKGLLSSTIQSPSHYSYTQMEYQLSAED